jgi:hypothetical protein
MNGKTVKSFFREVTAFLKGDTDAVKAERIYRQALNAYNLQISARQGLLIAKEQEIEAAEQALRDIRINRGNDISVEDLTSGAFVQRVLQAKANLAKIRKEKADTEKELEQLREEIAWLDREEDETAG